MNDLEMLPCFLVRSVEVEKNKYEDKRIFDCEKENEKFLQLYEKIVPVLYKATDYFEVSEGYENFFNQLKNSFLFSVKKGGYDNSESFCFDYLMKFLGLSDDLNLIENFGETVSERLEELDIFMFNVKGYTLVFYFGSLKVQSSLYYKRWEEEKKIKVFNQIKEKSLAEHKLLKSLNDRFPTNHDTTINLIFEELIESL